jgi:PAS domain S-box-containing protein
MWDNRTQAPARPDYRPVSDDGRAALALNAAEMGEFEWDLARDVFLVSERMAAITGVPAGEMPARGGQASLDFVHPDDRSMLRDLVADSLDREERYNVRYRIVRPDTGQILWMYSAAVLIRDDSGAIERVIGVLRDISDRKAEEDEREALVAELDHRVKNVLASVQSMAAQSARRTVSLDAFLKTFGGRLEAMAAAHTLLTTARWRGADIGHIAAAELGGLALGQARWEGPEIVLNPRATNALTLALHELGSNAIKYGALSTETGRVDVRWVANVDGGFTLTWTELNGPCVVAPSHRGFGHTLLEQVTGRELGGPVVIDFHPGGLCATIRADVTALAHVPARPLVTAMAIPAPAPDEKTGGASVGELRAEGIRGVRVLIVEDAVLLALELEAGLEEAGAVVVGAAADLEEAERMLALSFDVAVLDANLNGKSVIPVARALAARGTPFIFATGYDEAGVAPEGFTAPVVRKPYNVRQIAAALVVALGR